MKRLLLIILGLFLMMPFGFAQRQTDRLNRGLTAINTQQGVYCSWRILGEEYYDVTYNLYRNGVKVNAEPLAVSCFTDASGSASSRYTVSAVVRGQEQAQCEAVGVWAQNYLELVPDHGQLTSTYVPNDACFADVDGDGELEILLKFDNQSWANTSYQREGFNGEYFIIEVYKLNGTRLWWIDLGPNMADFQNNEQNIVAYDWDQDGKAEAVMRASDGTVIHMADGTEYVIGDKSKNYLAATSEGQWFVHEGNEYLVYMNGETGKPYQVMDYPLKRLEADETDLNKAWGDGYGHRSTKHFFGAPYLDGRKASIFLARGIYTRHKMIALDVNPATHELTERWRWNCNDASSPWYGNGYHNYAIADVDWDGRDEICFGSMVIDDNGKGLSTTGFGHGDAQHHGDFNPYVHGQEIFACLEDAPYWGNNYRDGTTSKVYYKYTSGRDDGRCIAGNFSNDYPGAMAFSGYDDPISCVTAEHISGMGKGTIPDNFRIYWDGDLCEEGFNYVNGKNTAGGIYKYGKGLIETLTGSKTNNDTKGTACYQGDILGDWREEVIMRTADNKIRIYTTTIPTEWRIPTLWHDLQYRQAMVWQMCGYNQPPHVSYFLGELEGITQAPPALTMTNRTEIAAGGSITASHAGLQLLLAATGDMTVSVSDGASPYILFDNAPSWVQGHGNNNNIGYTYYTHTLTGGAFTGSMRLVKQGDGMLVLPNVTETYSGPTDVWAGTLSFDGIMQNSRVWLNRFAELNSDGGRFVKGIQMDYASVLRPGGKGKVGRVETDSLLLNFGSRVQFDVAADGQVDAVKASVLALEKKDWQYGPQYSTPVFEIVKQGELPVGKYLLVEAGKVEGSVSDIVLEGVEGSKASLVQDDAGIFLLVEELRAATDITWDGGTDGIWDLASTENFLTGDGAADVFVTGDAVTFDDQASQTTVVVKGDVSPKSVVFNNETKDFTLSGDGSIIGTGYLSKTGDGKLTILNTNRFSGGARIEGGLVEVSSLANTDGTEYGALGGVSNTITLRNNGVLAVSDNIVCSQPFRLDGKGGSISVPAGKTMTVKGTVSATIQSTLRKVGAGVLSLNGSAGYDVLEIEQGTLQGGEINDVHQYPSTIILDGGTLKDPDNIYSYSTNKANVVVPEGKTAVWTLDSRCYYKGKLTGEGTLTVNVTSVRCQMQGDWSQFAGTLIFKHTKTGSFDPLIWWDNSYGLPNATVSGVFDNHGKSVSIKTISGDATFTGSGRYTAENLDITVTRVRGNNSNTLIEVEGTLAVTGNIDITLRGTSLKAGEEMLLWKVGTLQASSAVINLPALPAGLYWDTSELLQNEGKLKVTDQPTGISNLKQELVDRQIYTLDGVPVEKPLKKGIYVKNGKKIVIK